MQSQAEIYLKFDEDLEYTMVVYFHFLSFH